MDYLHYFRESDEYMRSLFMCMDNAHAVEKMYSWDNIGIDNPAWKEGPYISSGRRGIPISREQPYVLRISAALSKLIAYQSSPPSEGKKSFRHKDNSIPANKIIPTVSICMQFALLEDYDRSEFNRYKESNNISDDKKVKRYDRKPVKERLSIVEELTEKKVGSHLCNAYLSVSNLRNLLTHEPQYLCNSPITAIDYYVTCQAIASVLNRVLGTRPNDAELDRRECFWEHQLHKFDEVIEF